MRPPEAGSAAERRRDRIPRHHPSLQPAPPNLWWKSTLALVSRVYSRTMRTYRLPLVVALIVFLRVWPWSMEVSAQTPLVDSATMQRAQASGTVRVLVELGSLNAVPEGLLHSHGAVTSQRRDIAAAQEGVDQALAGQRHRVVRRFQTVPLLAMDASPVALQKLASMRGVVLRVHEDRIEAPMLAQSGPLVGAAAAWNAGPDGSGTVIAILDGGVDSRHPFLAGKVVAEACFSSSVPGQSTTFCPNGLETQTGGGSARPCTLVSECAHGTHVAGIAAGNGAAAGRAFSGVARGANLVAVQVFSRITRSQDCGGWAPCAGTFISDQMAALEYIYALRNVHNFASVNVSFGGNRFFSACDGDLRKPFIDNLRSAGIATVAASGNDGSRNSMATPACISTAVSVAATTKTDTVWPSSNVASFLSLFAPGASITSSVPGSDFATLDGTSMAAPHVAGAFAVLKQAVPRATVREMLRALQLTGRPVSDAAGITRPRIQVDAALGALTAPPEIVAAVLPTTRSVQVGRPATAFATIINAGVMPAAGCFIAPPVGLAATFTFQTTNPATNVVIGMFNTPVDIPGGTLQTFVFALTPTAAFPPLELVLSIDCSNTESAPQISRVSTFELGGSDGPVPDIIALAATFTNDGIVNIPGVSGIGAFAVASVNVGATAQITVSAELGIPGGAPVTLSLCQTNPRSGGCLAARSTTVTTEIQGGSTPTFAIFVQGNGNVTFDPANNRVNVLFKDLGGLTRGATGVAIRTQ